MAAAGASGGGPWSPCSACATCSPTVVPTAGDPVPCLPSAEETRALSCLLSVRLLWSLWACGPALGQPWASTCSCSLPCAAAARLALGLPRARVSGVPGSRPWCCPLQPRPLLEVPCPGRVPLVWSQVFLGRAARWALRHSWTGSCWTWPRSRASFNHCALRTQGRLLAWACPCRPPGPGPGLLRCPLWALAGGQGCVCVGGQVSLCPRCCRGTRSLQGTWRRRPSAAVCKTDPRGKHAECLGPHGQP